MQSIKLKINDLFVIKNEITNVAIVFVRIESRFDKKFESFFQLINSKKLETFVSTTSNMH